VKGAGFQQRAGHFLMIKRALRELNQCHHSHFFWYIQNPVYFNTQDLIILKKYHDLPSTISWEDTVVVFVSREAMHRLEKIFRNQPTRNKNSLWQPCLLTDRDEISNLCREPSIETSYQVSVQLAKKGRRILEIDQSETRIACSSHACYRYGRFCIKFPQSRMKSERHRRSPLSL
jgi:hypothetical protein